MYHRGISHISSNLLLSDLSKSCKKMGANKVTLLSILWCLILHYYYYYLCMTKCHDFQCDWSFSLDVNIVNSFPDIKTRIMVYTSDIISGLRFFLSVSFFLFSFLPPSLFLVHLCMCGDHNSKKSSFFPLGAKKM